MLHRCKKVVLSFKLARNVIMSTEHACALENRSLQHKGGKAGRRTIKKLQYSHAVQFVLRHFGTSQNMGGGGASVEPNWYRLRIRQSAPLP